MCEDRGSEPLSINREKLQRLREIVGNGNGFSPLLGELIAKNPKLQIGIGDPLAKDKYVREDVDASQPDFWEQITEILERESANQGGVIDLFIPLPMKEDKCGVETARVLRIRVGGQRHGQTWVVEVALLDRNGIKRENIEIRNNGNGKGSAFKKALEQILSEIEIK